MSTDRPGRLSAVLAALVACDRGAVDTGTTPHEGVLVLAGGGSEGDDHDASAWSAGLYGALLDGGDVTGDGQVRVAVLSASAETAWIPDYFEWLGADKAFNLKIAQVSDANAASLVDKFADVDAVFIKGGDQGEYYDAWNGTVLEAQIRAVRARGGGVGGTSAGAMSQSEYALAGGADYVSADALSDACTPYLDDVSDGGTGVHTDFLGFVGGALVDTHFATRARLGRLAGALAKAIDDGAPPDLLGVGLDEQTGIVVRGADAEVRGVGSVVFLVAGDEPAVRIPGQPLVWAGLALDRLTAGWRYDLANRTATPPADAERVDAAPFSSGFAGDWAADGAIAGDEEGFQWVVQRAPDAYAVRAGAADPLFPDAFGLMNAHDADRRGANDEAAFRALYDHPEAVGFLVGAGGRMERSNADPVVLFGAGGSGDPLATVVLDAHAATWRSLSPSVSAADAGDGALHAAGLTGVTVDVLYTPADGRGFDLDDRTVHAR